MPIALITGGTAGIGAAFARALAARGYDLVLVARGAERLEQVAAGLRAEGRDVETLAADMGDAAGRERVAQRLSARERPIDLLVNNAGYGPQSTLRAPDLTESADALAVMVHAPLELSAAVLPGMLERRSGAIINVGSVAGYFTMGLYSSVKAWLRVYSEGLHAEVAGSGVTVTALLPGWVHTEFHDRAEIDKSAIPSWLWLDADRLVADALRDVDRGRALSIPSRRYRAVAWWARHLPAGLIRRMSASMTDVRHRTEG